MFRKLAPVFVGALIIIQIISAFILITSIMAVIGCLAILISAIRWELKGGIYSATLCSMIVLTGHILTVLQSSEWLSIIVTILLYYALGIGVGGVIGTIRKQRLSLILSETRYKSVNLELTNEKERLNVTLNSIGDGVIATDVEGNIKIINKVASELTGWDVHDATGRAFSEVFNIENEDSGVRRNNLVAEVMRKGHSIELESNTILISKYGKKGYITDSAAPIKDASGNISGMIIVFRDNTELKKAEDALQSNQRQLSDIIEFLPDATLAINTEKRVIIWNKAIENMTGISAAEMIGKGDHGYAVPFYSEAKPDFIDLIFLDDEEIKTKYPNLTREGDTLITEKFCPALYNNKGAWVFSKVSPLHDQFGNIIGAIESLRDITEYKQAVDALKLSEKKYSSYVENAPDGVFISDETGHYLEVNRAASEITGYSKDELLKMKIGDMIPVESQVAGMNHFKRLLETGSSSGALQYKHKNNSTRWWTVDAVKLTDHSFLGFAKDITDQKYAEDKILYLSYRDQLTGLYNRRFFEEELKRLDTKRNFPLTIVMGDVDGLKLFNDSIGHDKGDELLRKSAEVIKKGCRADDIIARLGGDEFVIILPKTSAFETEQIIKRINELLLKEKVGNINISISFGYKTKNNEDEKIEEIFKYAEEYMYINKRSKIRE